MWQDFEVDHYRLVWRLSESTMFAYATGFIDRKFLPLSPLESYNVIAHFNEWMLGAGALYIKKHVPKIATIFTTHANHNWALYCRK